jgi:K+-sensing histidine kinase KdpD
VLRSRTGSENRNEAERLERSTLLRIERTLSQRSPGFVVVVSLLLLALIGLLDAVSGPFAVSVFYFLPVALVTFTRGRWIGALVSGVAAVAWSATEVVQHATTLQSQVPYWNALTRFYAFMAVVLLIGPMRDALVWQRELATKESEAAEHLRTLNELREALQQPVDVPDDGSMPGLSELRDPVERLDTQV